jgi:membrane protease YdiL (CAAX protease family)
VVTAADVVQQRRSWWRSVLAVVAVLVVGNVVSNRLLPAALYVPWNVLIAVTVVAIATREVSRESMGWRLDRRVARWSLTLAGLTAAGLAIVAAVPAWSELFDDRRVSASTWTMLYHTVVRIPLGTVVLEEVAFRSVLPALFATRWSLRRAAVAASALFGLWHVLPATTLNRVNPLTTRLFGEGADGVLAAVLFAVLSTFAAGLWWCWVRYRSGSVVTTVVAHVSTNSLAYLFAWWLAR